MQSTDKSRPKTEELLRLPDATSQLQLGISPPTIKQWIYKKKIRSIKTAGGHHRIPQSEVDRLLFKTRGKTQEETKQVMRGVSGRNQLVGRIESVRISGLMAEVADFNWRPADHINYHRAFRARYAAKIGANAAALISRLRS